MRQREGLDNDEELVGRSQIPQVRARLQPSFDVDILSALEKEGEPSMPQAYEYFPFTHFRQLARDLDSSVDWDHSTECFFYSKTSHGCFAISSTYIRGDHGLTMAGCMGDTRHLSVHVRQLNNEIAESVVRSAYKAHVRLTNDKLSEFLVILMMRMKAASVDVAGGESLALQTPLALLDIIAVAKSNPQVQVNIEGVVDKCGSVLDFGQQQGLIGLVREVEASIPEYVSSARKKTILAEEIFKYLLEKKFPEADYSKTDTDIPVTSFILPEEASLCATLADLIILEGGFPRPEPYPSYEKLQNYVPEAAYAEYVPLDKLVGGQYGSSWFTSDGNERGKPAYTYKIMSGLVSSSISITGHHPIHCIEVDGKYYISQDGRHRAAALKLLGVKAVPMLVHPYRSKTVFP